MPRDHNKQPAPTCCWVLADGTPCGAPVMWRMGWDNDEPGTIRVRKYAPYCGPHDAKSKARPFNPNDEDTE